jgi:hypothetical protein
LDYESAAKRYLDVRDAIDEMERAHKEAKAKLTERLNALEQWFTAKAQEDKLEKVPTAVGLAYWATHSNATVADRAALFDFCKANDKWDLIESRASKTAVRSHIEATGEVPPGVNFSTVRVFNLRRASAAKATLNEGTQ